MKILRRHYFYAALLIYGAYNILWLCGVMFSFGKNDTSLEAVYFGLTFLADIPVFCLLARKLNFGAILFVFLLVVGILMAESLHVLNAQSIMYWYSPKFLPLAMAVWVNRAPVVGGVQ